MNDLMQSEKLLLASKWLPFGVLLGSIFCGVGAMEVEKWYPIVLYIAPWVIYMLLHYANKGRFLREADWCMRLKITGQFFIFVYSPCLSVYAILVKWYGIYYGIVSSIIYTFLVYYYFYIYLDRARSAWEEKMTSNYRFAIDPSTLTFRYGQGFNFGPIPGMWWDNLIFGALLSLTTFSGALIGDMAGDLGIGKLVTLTASVLWTLIWTRGTIVRELISLEKIREYEQEHDVTIRPR